MAIRVATLILFSASAGVIGAAELSGTVVIERKLTHRNVTPVTPDYQRGTPVALGAPVKENPLSFERSHVVVYVEGKGPAATSATANMEQQDRQFVPDLLVVPVGSTVSFPNLDAIFHNVFSLSKPKSFNLGNYSKGQTRTITFPNPGVVYVYCHLHPNMAASIMITPNQWATKAQGDGRFRIADVPPGKYTVVAWHKAAGFFRQTVTVTENGAPALQFVIPFAAEREGLVTER